MDLYDHDQVVQTLISIGVSTCLEYYYIARAIKIRKLNKNTADGVLSTSTDGARATNEIRKRFRVRDNLPLQH